MSKIVHYCPKCNKKLHVEDEEGYMGRAWGCTLSCSKCGCTLIAVDISVCQKCVKSTKERCINRFLSRVTINGKKV